MTPTAEEVEAVARRWVLESLKRDFNFYDEPTCRDILDKSEGRTRIKAFIAGYNAALDTLRSQRGDKV